MSNELEKQNTDDICENTSKLKEHVNDLLENFNEDTVEKASQSAEEAEEKARIQREKNKQKALDESKARNSHIEQPNLTPDEIHQLQEKMAQERYALPQVEYKFAKKVAILILLCVFCIAGFFIYQSMDKKAMEEKINENYIYNVVQYINTQMPSTTKDDIKMQLSNASFETENNIFGVTIDVENNTDDEIKFVTSGFRILAEDGDVITPVIEYVESNTTPSLGISANETWRGNIHFYVNNLNNLKQSTFLLKSIQKNGQNYDLEIKL